MISIFYSQFQKKKQKKNPIIFTNNKVITFQKKTKKTMSTAFLVDNILNDKEDHAESLSSDTESDTTSDLKDSICGSPDTNEMHHHHHHHHLHHHHNHHLDQSSSSPIGEENTSPQLRINQFSKTFLRTYNTMVMRNNNMNNATDNLSDNNFIEMCCTKCGHFQQQQQQLVKRLDINHHHISTASVTYDDNTDIEIEFKCDKCDSNEGVKTSTMTTSMTPTTMPPTKSINSNNHDEQTTILKDSAKPILKFSVSAILSDKKEYAKVRNGKRNLFKEIILFSYVLFRFCGLIQ